MDLSTLQGLMVVVGPILLAAVLLWAVLHNRGSKRALRHTEEATKRRYEEQARDDRLQDRA